jgi:hypothetical protein
MTPRAVLDLIDAYLSDPKEPLEQRRALWDILAGVRGADRKKDRAMGHDVVGVIRAHAFPKTARTLKGKPGFRPRFDPVTSLRAAAGKLDGGGHFQTHAWRAMLALAEWGPPATAIQLVPKRENRTGGVR